MCIKFSGSKIIRQCSWEEFCVIIIIISWHHSLYMCMCTIKSEYLIAWEILFVWPNLKMTLETTLWGGHLFNQRQALMNGLILLSNSNFQIFWSLTTRTAGLVQRSCSTLWNCCLQVQSPQSLDWEATPIAPPTAQVSQAFTKTVVNQLRMAVKGPVE